MFSSPETRENIRVAFDIAVKITQTMGLRNASMDDIVGIANDVFGMLETGRIKPAAPEVHVEISPPSISLDQTARRQVVRAMLKGVDEFSGARGKKKGHYVLNKAEPKLTDKQLFALREFVESYLPGGAVDKDFVG